MSDWKITKGHIPIDELQAYIQDLSDIRNKEDFPKLRFREETLWAFNTIRKVEIASNQKFVYQKNSNSWLVDPVEGLYTDFVDVKEQLRAEGVKKVIVAGVEKELKRVSEISSGLLHLVFEYEGETEHFYSTKNTRLRVREGKIATEYLLDHVKRMHV